MHGSIKALLATVTTAAAIATAVSASTASTGTGAAPAPAPTPTSAYIVVDYKAFWPKSGYYKSSNDKAWARGHVWVRKTGPGKNDAHVTGWLTDKDNRTEAQGGMCAYAMFTSRRVGGSWGQVKYYKQCGYNKSKRINHHVYNVDKILVTVCQRTFSPPYTTKKCGSTKFIYPFVSAAD